MPTGYEQLQRRNIEAVIPARACTTGYPEHDRDKYALWLAVSTTGRGCRIARSTPRLRPFEREESACESENGYENPGNSCVVDSSVGGIGEDSALHRVRPDRECHCRDCYVSHPVLSRFSLPCKIQWRSGPS